MLEMLINPRKAERRPWEMFFVGLLYASLSVLLVEWIFGQDVVLVQYSGVLVVTFSVMFTLPFMYYLIKDEGKKEETGEGGIRLLRSHSTALTALLFLFVGFIVAFSFWYIVLGSENNFKAQIETYCMINRPDDIKGCAGQYGVKSNIAGTGYLTAKERVIGIFANNIYVMIFTLIFSLVFGAGAIFVLAWNASVIAAAIGIFAREQVSQIPLGVARYMIHGMPEIAAYFIAAMAGGILGVGVIRHRFRDEKFWTALQDSLNLIIAAIIVLFIAALVEVFITPALF